MMSQWSTRLLKSCIDAMRLTGAAGVYERLSPPVGAILMLHHVVPSERAVFAPNGLLEITPEFLARTVRFVREKGFDVVSLDEAAERLQSTEPHRPFVCLTFDDGYRDNRDHAYPVLKKLDAPFAIYVPTDYADGRGNMWWRALEGAIRMSDEIRFGSGRTAHVFQTDTVARKYQCYFAIYWALRSMFEDDARAEVDAIAARAGFDAAALVPSLVMGWDELRDLARDPLVTIGGHTIGHYALAKLCDERAFEEMAESKRRLTAELGKPCHHFSYPYGDAGSAGPREFAFARELGYRTAVTTRKGVVTSGEAVDLSALPRLSLNGNYQDVGTLGVLLSGLPFRLLDIAGSLLPGAPAPPAGGRGHTGNVADSNPAMAAGRASASTR